MKYIEKFSYIVAGFLIGLIIMLAMALPEMIVVDMYFCDKFPDAIIYYCGDTPIYCDNRGSISCNTYAINRQMTTEDMLDKLSSCSD